MSIFYRRYWDTRNQLIVLRPCFAPLARSEQDITRTDNLYTRLLQSSQFYGRYKELFTLYVLCPSAMPNYLSAKLA